MIKCYECRNQNLTKTEQPCSECEHRPHDLCTSDKFEPAKEYPISAEKSFESWEPIVDEVSNKIKFSYLSGFKSGEKNQELRHRETISLSDWFDAFKMDTANAEVLEPAHVATCAWNACKKSHGL